MHWYILNDMGEILGASEENTFGEEGIYSEEEIVSDYKGKLVFLHETQTEEYKTLEQAHSKQQINYFRISELKAELEKVMEDIQQEQLGFVRNDYAEKKVRAAEIINELRVLEGKEPRKIKTE